MTHPLTPMRICSAAIAAVTISITACGAPLVAPGTVIQAAPGWTTVAIPTLPQGFRAAEFDAARESIWILTDEPGAPPTLHSAVTLIRLGVRDHSVTQASFSMNGDAYVKGLISLDAANKLWLAWGQTLAEYDPDTNSATSWPLPPIRTVPSPASTVDQGRAVSMDVASSGEVWVATLGFENLVGFNPVTRQWDRQIALPILPDKSSRITEPSPGHLLLNGSTSSVGSSQSERLIDIDVGAGKAIDRNLDAKDYVLNTSDQIVYLDNSNFGKRGVVSTQSSVTLTARLHVANSPDLVADSQGHAWFNMLGYRSVGVGRIDYSTGAVTEFPFPYIDRPGIPLPSASGCPVQVGCVPSDAVFDPEIQSIVVDGHNNVWVFTRVGGGASSLSAPSAVYELTPQG